MLQHRQPLFPNSRFTHCIALKSVSTNATETLIPAEPARPVTSAAAITAALSGSSELWHGKWGMDGGREEGGKEGGSGQIGCSVCEKRPRHTMVVSIAWDDPFSSCESPHVGALLGQRSVLCVSTNLDNNPPPPPPLHRHGQMFKRQYVGTHGCKKRSGNSVGGR